MKNSTSDKMTNQTYTNKEVYTNQDVHAELMDKLLEAEKMLKDAGFDLGELLGQCDIGAQIEMHLEEEADNDDNAPWWL